ncbi:MAG: ice-binding family protein, partial [Ilumatobacteraceae bacterium]
TAQLAAGTLTLDANNDPNAIWIFQLPGTTLVTAASTQILLTRGAQACNIYWQVGSSATLGASSTFRGNILADTSITVGNSVTVNGRLLAGAVTTSGSVTLDTDTITKASCASSSSSIYGYLTVIKTVINNNGGTKLVSDFPLFIGPTRVTSSVAYAVVPDTYAVTETNLPGYSASVWGGACSPSGIVTVATGEVKVCTITNDDIAGAAIPVSPPLISIEKLPSPLSLPGGAGLVTYTYTVSNIGPVPIERVTVIDNKCAQVTYVSGDTNSNSILSTTETWTYRCAITVGQTTTNSATAVGYSTSGISTTDIAFATVVVGAPIPPPLIFVTKTPNRFVVPFGGGSVTYTYQVTNPGVVALNNVSLVDDKCTNMSDPSGDTNDNGRLGVNETWTYTCTMRITSNTVNTVTATGNANGLTAIDFALATVVVAPAGATPGFPNTGIGPDEKNTHWNLIIPIGVVAALFFVFGVRRKQAR